jgi:tetratricopeptide (TPR) repeat protein
MGDERKLKAVYDAIDSGNFKNAVKLCLKKDIADWEVTKALLAYSYVKSKQEDQALLLARQVVLRRPSHPSILVPLRYTFKALRLEQDLIQMYEGALQSDPTNIDHAQELFGCYVRQGQAKEMQMLAQGLFRATGSAQYVFWAVTSMLHAATVPPMVLMLAEKMIHKAIYQTDVDSTKRHGKAIQPGAEELHLYVDILCRQGKWEEGLAALDELRARAPTKTNGKEDKLKDEQEFESNPSAVKMFELQAHTLRMEILFQLNRREEAEQQLCSLLDLFPDHWDGYSKLIDSTLVRSAATSDVAEAAAPVVALRALILERRERDPLLRASWLAEMILLQRWYCQAAAAGASDADALPAGWTTSSAPADFTLPGEEEAPASIYLLEASRLLAGYVEKFGTKACCFSDLKPVLEGVHTCGVAAVSCLSAFRSWCLARAAATQQTLEDACATDKVREATTTEALPHREKYMKLICGICKTHQLAVFCEALLRDLGVDIESDMARYQNLTSLFTLSLPLGAHGIGGDREVQPCDELMLLLSAHHRRAAQSGTVDDHLLWAVMLQSAMNLSAHNYSFPLEALDPLRALAAGKASLTAFSKLGVKHVQVHPCLYHIHPPLPSIHHSPQSPSPSG